MKSRILAGSTVLALLTGATLALAQAPAATPAIVSPATPATAAAPGRYTGPSATPVVSVKQLLDSGRDDQYARLQGRIVSHDGGKNYTLADDSGRMPVEISARRFPAGQTISAEQRVELVGKLDKGFRQTKFEVKEIRLLP